MNNLKEFIYNTLVTNEKVASRFRSVLDKFPIEKEAIITHSVSCFGVEDLKLGIYSILSEEHVQPLCSSCDKEIPFKPMRLNGKFVITDKKYCSKKCAQYSLEAKELREKTCEERYGNKNVFATEYGKEKIKETNLDRYGVENPQQRKEIREKTETTLTKIYGGIGTSSKEIKEKGIATYKEKTGYKFSGQNPEVKEKIKETNLERYGSHFNQKHINKESLEKLSDFEFILKENYENNKTGVQIASELGVTNRVLYKKFEENGIKINPENYISIDELELNEYLLFIDPDLEIIRNKRLFGFREIDFYLPKYNLAIEYNGTYWHSELRGKTKKYHLTKTTECEKNGIQLLHIFSNEWNYNKEVIKSIICNKLQHSTTFFARKCKIVKLEQREYSDFLEKNHRQGLKNSLVRIGLTYNNELVSVMGFSKRNESSDWELDRFCNKNYFNIAGGASKLLAYFRKHNKGSIISFADRRYSTGNVYNKLGFKLLESSEPNYWYTKDYKTLHSRLKFQKHKLEEQLETFKPDLSEWENMKLNGFDRIWDCGSLKFYLE